MQEISIGDYVLSGGELAALVLLDSIVRLLPGVMGAADSADRGKLLRAVCWNIRTTPAPPNGRDAACRTCCYPAIMAPSRPGGRRKRNESPASAAPICGRIAVCGRQSWKARGHSHEHHPAVRGRADRSPDSHPRGAGLSFPAIRCGSRSRWSKATAPAHRHSRASASRAPTRA